MIIRVICIQGVIQRVMCDVFIYSFQRVSSWHELLSNYHRCSCWLQSTTLFSLHWAYVCIGNRWTITGYTLDCLEVSWLL